MLGNHRGAKIGLVFLTLLLSDLGCAQHRSTPPTDSLTLTSADSAGVTILTLSHSPNEVANGLVIADTLPSTMVLGGASGEILSIGDVAALNGGLIAIADTRAHEITLIGPDGQKVGSIGRDGDGPGEFRSPNVVEASPRELLVQSGIGRLSTFSLRDYSLIAVEEQPVPGDWAHLSLRRPYSAWDREKRQVSIEDVSKRFGGFFSGGFLLQVQDDERFAPPEFPFTQPPVYLVRTDSSLDRFDTVAVLTGPPSLRFGSQNESRYEQFTQPVYASRPVWAAGTGWLALGQGNLDEIGVRCGEALELCVLIRWPSTSRALTQEEKEAWVDWEYRYQLRISKGEHRDRLLGLSEREKRRLASAQIDITEFSAVAPEVTELRGDGRCLFVAGFNPWDTYRGVSATWIALDLVENQVLGVVRIPGIGRRVRDVKDASVYTTYSDELMVDVLEVFSAQGIQCSGFS